MPGRARDSLLGSGSMVAYLPAALVYLSLGVFPDRWGEEGRYQLLLQFYMVEFCGGLMVGAVGKLVVERSAAMATFGAGLILAVSLTVVGMIGWTTGSVGVMAMVAVPLLPRVFGAVRLARSGPRMGAMLLREGAISTAGCVLIGFGYVAGMSAGPNDPPNTLSVPPPIGYVATAMAVYYLVLGYFAGNQEGAENWIESGKRH